ncbi:DUF3570 domain-containing protein [Glaciecola sp. KUL10]|uniref:DUF3570 domain-containing protein n=1 Tax=Glaciecola sp. (strain KUL10) TaxID=2161813 RepID=UPI001F37E2A6|nr:DUF3570 domain-containing protein [Glaciecola sp. KUL10]
MKKDNKTLALLSIAATNLIATQCTQAVELATDFQFGYRHHMYDESPLPNSLGDSTDRYNIRVNQFSLLAPLTDSFDMSLSYQHERMSGASPWFTISGPDGEVVQVMSGATIEDERTDASINLRYKRDNFRYGIVAAISSEDDYLSRLVGVEVARESEDKRGTFSVSLDVSNDDINPVDADLFLTRPAVEQTKRSTSAVVSYSYVLSKNTLAQFSAGYISRDGYLSDPYKLALVDFNLIGDSRPSSRYAKTLASRFRYFSDTLNGAFHADYRYYDDSWDVESHTFDLAWYQNLPYDFQLVPSIRHYAQKASFFYEVFYESTRDDGFYSTDYRLSEYGATTYGLKLSKQFTGWSFTVSFDKYESGGAHGLAKSDVENPGLLDFELVQLGVNATF